MGTIVQRKTKFRAIVRLSGMKPVTKSFPSRKEANHWITQTEAAAVTKPTLKRGNTLGFALEKIRLLELEKPYRSGTPSFLTSFIQKIGHMDIADCTESWWKETILSWPISPYSRLNAVLRLQGALRKAEALYSTAVNWEALRLACSKLTIANKLGKGTPRSRRASNAEIKMLKVAAAEYRGKLPMADIIDFAVATCMRQAEICRVTWDDLSTDPKGRPMLKVRDRKHPKKKMGNHQDIPLLNDAYKIIQRQPRKRCENGSLDARIFPFNEREVCRVFTDIVRKTSIKDLHFHDLRHEGITRLFEQGFSIDEVCKVSGHTNWETLRIYTHTGSSLHDGPVAHRRAA